MNQGVILAIETSQHVGGVALRDRQGRIHVEMLAQSKRHDDDLLPAIDRLFARCGLKPRDLAEGDRTAGQGPFVGGGVGVSIGPGGFTGLRIAVTTAKMLSETLGTRVIAVPSALVAAESHMGQGPIAVALACKAESFWLTRLQRDPSPPFPSGPWSIADQPGLARADSLDLNGIEALLADAHLPEWARSACARAGIAIIPPRFEPAACLAVAQRMLAAGGTTDPLMLAPLYPRPPEAVTLWEKRATT